MFTDLVVSLVRPLNLYFHLWNNGTPHWEREKRLWEEEQEKEWTEVMSKRSKRAAAKKAVITQKVRFAKPLIQSPPRKPPPLVIQFGYFSCAFDLLCSENLRFGSLMSEAEDDHNRVLRQPEPQRSPSMQSSEPPADSQGNFPDQVNPTSDSISNSLSPASGPSCTRCSSSAHHTLKCPSRIRCWACQNYGHMRKFCSHTRLHFVWIPKDTWKPIPPEPRRTRTRPSLVWRPKSQ